MNVTEYRIPAVAFLVEQPLLDNIGHAQLQFVMRNDCNADLILKRVSEKVGGSEQSSERTTKPRNCDNLILFRKINDLYLQEVEVQINVHFKI